jgi:hypothetical protein
LMGTFGTLQQSALPVAHATTTFTTTTIVDGNNNNNQSLLLLSEILSQLQQAQQQLETVPSLIDKRQWDSVRAVLIVPPLSDCWVPNRRSLLLPQYVQLLEGVGGDDYAALQIMEDLRGHLRFLDMAVYNNNFNPIVVEGTTNASPTLIESYYQDPIKEYRASQSALQELMTCPSHYHNDNTVIIVCTVRRKNCRGLNISDVQSGMFQLKTKRQSPALSAL